MRQPPILSVWSGTTSICFFLPHKEAEQSIMILKNSISHSFGFTTLQPYFPTSFSSCFWIPHDHFPKCVQIFPDFCWISIGFPITLGLGKLRRMLQQLKPETVVSLVEAPMFLVIKRGMVDAFPWDLGFSIGFSGFGDEN